VVVDSRQATEGSLFVALPGEHTDGHRFVGDAFRRGARAALVHRPVEVGVATASSFRPLAAACRGETARVLGGAALIDVTQPLPPDVELPLPVCLLVQDTLTTLQTLAAYWRNQHPQCHVVGITGSVGKTTTKELIAGVLRQRFCTLSSPENYNNEIGLPLSVLRLGAGVEWLAQEIAMYDVGEIALLARIAQPEIGVVTNVGPTHLERLGSIERIAQAKSELVQALPGHGLALLNGDDPRVRAMAELTPARQILFYGLQPHNDLWADEVQTHGLEGLSLRIHFHSNVVQATLPVLGRHNVYGVLAAVGVGLTAGMAWEQVIAGLQDRSAQVRLLVVPGMRGTTILDDTYNASPASTIAALDLLSDEAAVSSRASGAGASSRAGGTGRKVAVLGGMLELGSFEEEGHRLVGRRAAETVSLLVTVGKLGRLIAEEALACGLPQASVHQVADNDEAVQLLKRILGEGDVVLVKGSRGIAMENIVAKIRRGAERN
jgi:UDP-N-acetylmuramoyl-tripeptide--D-alanyl-D-alanine ligase